MAPDRRRRRLAGLGLDQPGIDQDQPVEPGLGAEQGQSGGAVAQAEADDAARGAGIRCRSAAAAALRSGPLPRKPGSSPALSPTPRRSKRRQDSPLSASDLASLSYMRCEPIRVWLPPVTSSRPVAPAAAVEARRQLGALAGEGQEAAHVAAPFGEVGGDRLGELGRTCRARSGATSAGPSSFASAAPRSVASRTVRSGAPAPASRPRSAALQMRRTARSPPIRPRRRGPSATMSRASAAPVDRREPPPAPRRRRIVDQGAAAEAGDQRLAPLFQRHRRRRQ